MHSKKSIILEGYIDREVSSLFSFMLLSHVDEQYAAGAQVLYLSRYSNLNIYIHIDLIDSLRSEEKNPTHPSLWESLGVLKI